MDTLQLNGFRISQDNLDALNAANFPGLPTDLIDEIKAFLQSWWDDTDAIQVKTSGSTGAPKTISMPKAVVIASAEKTIAYFGLKADDSALLCLPVRYIAGKLMIVRAIRANLNLVAVEPNLSPLDRLGQSFKFAAMIPAQAATCLNSAEGLEKLTRIDQLLIGGGPIEPHLEEQLIAASINAYHSYGMTETATHVALRKIGEADYTALPGVRFETDDRGCLIVRAEHIPGSIVTNDLVELQDQHRFRWLGRIDHVINSGGIKHIPETLEKQISPLIEAPFYIVGQADSLLGERLILVIEGPAVDESDQQKLLAQIEALLDKHAVPKEIRFVDQFERTSTGKIKRLPPPD